MLDATNVIATQGVTILSIPALVQWMKQSHLPWLNWITEKHSNTARWVAWAIGVVAATGIHGELQHIGHIWDLRVDYSEFSLAAMLHTALAIGGQLGGQEAVYRIYKIAESIDKIASAVITTKPANTPAAHTNTSEEVPTWSLFKSFGS